MIKKQNMIINKTNRLFRRLNLILFCSSYSKQINVVFSYSLLVCCSLFSAVKSSYILAGNSNASVDNFLFGPGLFHHSVTLPYWHSNIIKIPLFYFLGHFGQSYNIFFIFNALLIILTTVGWLYLLVKIFGHKYQLIIALLLANLVFVSTTFSLQIGYTSVRNIEYPIALAFILVIQKIIKKNVFNTREILLSTIISLLYILVLASDTFFQYTISFSLLLTIIFYLIQSRLKITINIVKAIGLILFTLALADSIKYLISLTGLIIFNYTWPPAISILPYRSLGPSISLATHQFIRLMGANIFNLAVNVANIPYFINFLILIIGTIGLISIILNSGRVLKNKIKVNQSNTIVLMTLACTFFLLFIEYNLSGKVLYLSINNHLTNFHQQRYLSLMPLIIIAGFIWLLNKYYNNYKTLEMSISLILILNILIAFPSVNQHYNQRLNDYKAIPTPLSVKPVAAVLKQYDVHHYLAAYWFGASVKQNSSDQRIQFSPIYNCNYPFNWNARNSWFNLYKSSSSALIIDNNSNDQNLLNCNQKNLRSIYGQPLKIINVHSINNQSSIYIWLYNYDLNTKLMPIPSTH